MNLPAFLAFILAVAGAIAAWASIVWLIPAQLRSMFRYRVWRLRDEFVDAVLDGRLQWGPSVDDLLERMEFTIRAARELTLVRLLSVHFLVRDLRLQERKPAHTDEEILLEEYRFRLIQLVAMHVMAGSPSGWIGSVLLSLIAPFYLRRRWGHKVRAGAHDLVVHTVEEEFAARAAIPWSRRRRRKPVSSYVG